MALITIDQYKEQNPQLKDVDNFELTKILHEKYYPQVPFRDFTRAVDVTDPNEPGNMHRGFSEAIDQVKPMAFGAMAGAAAAGESIAGQGGIFSAAKNYAVKGMQDANAKIAENAKPNDDITTAWDNAKQGDLGALVDWASHGLGYAAAQTLMAGGVTLAGAVVAPEAAIAGASGFVARGLITPLVEKESAKLAAKGVAADQIQKLAVSNVAKTIGATTALGAYETGMEGGEIGGGLAEKSVNEGRTLTPSELAKGFGSTILAAGGRTVIDSLNLSILKGDTRGLFGIGESLSGVAGKLTRGAAMGAKSGLAEGTEEAGQTYVEEYGKGNDLSSPETTNQVINATAMGALGGHAVGTVGGILSSPSIDDAIKNASDSVSKPSFGPLALTHQHWGLGDDRSHQAPNDTIKFSDGSQITADEFFVNRMREHGDEAKARQETYQALVNRQPTKFPIGIENKNIIYGEKPIPDISDANRTQPSTDEEVKPPLAGQWAEPNTEQANIQHQKNIAFHQNEQAEMQSKIDQLDAMANNPAAAESAKKIYRKARVELALQKLKKIEDFRANLGYTDLPYKKPELTNNPFTDLGEKLAAPKEPTGSIAERTASGGMQKQIAPASTEKTEQGKQEAAPTFTPTHITSDGAIVAATEEPYIYQDRQGNEYEDHYATPINKSNVPNKESVQSVDKNGRELLPDIGVAGHERKANANNNPDNAVKPILDLDLKDYLDHVRKQFKKDNPKAIPKVVEDRVKAARESYADDYDNALKEREASPQGAQESGAEKSASQESAQETREQLAHEKRVKDAGKKTTYYVGDTNLGKIAYDYANHLKQKQEEPNAKQKPEAAQPNGSSSTRPEIRQEDGNTPVSGRGVRESGQENKPEAKGEKGVGEESASEVTETADTKKAKADLDAALGDLGAFFLDNNLFSKKVVPGEFDDAKLMPIMARVMDAAIRLGYVKFKDAVKFTLDTIREKFGDKAADAISIDHLQGGYIAVAAKHGGLGTDNKKDVVNVDSIEEIHNHKPESKEFQEETKDNQSEINFQASKDFADRLLNGEFFKTIIQARQALTSQKIESGTQLAKQADETIELAGVLAARKAVDRGLSESETFDSLAKIANQMPSLNARSSTSIAQQAYSTPLPLAYVASVRAGITKKSTVLEPTAGNGALLIASNPEGTLANELNTDRAKALKEQGFSVTEKNAATMSFGKENSDVVIANPPFGAVKDDHGRTESFQVNHQYKTNEIDHAIALNALTAMKSNGKAVLIVGAPAKTLSEDGRSNAYNSKAKREFYYTLYNEYNVTDHFTVSGDLYAKQGAAWPVDVIVIDGRGKSKLVLPAANPPRTINSIEALKNELKNDSNGLQQSRVTTKQADANSTETGDAGREVGGGASDRRSDQDGQSGGLLSRPAGNTEESRHDSSGNVVGGGDKGSGQSGGIGNKHVALGNKYQAEYKPASKVNPIGTLVPVNMQSSVEEALQRLVTKHGDIDNYVAKQLDYKPEEIGKYFSAEQVDAIALALDNIENGKGFIIGDQTGVGKGRVNAAMIRYAIKNNITPVFVTEKNNLYGDMLRDLSDIGMDDVIPFATNSDESIPIDASANEWYTASERAKEEGLTPPPKYGKFITTPSSKKQNEAMSKMKDTGRLDDAQVIFTTYSQMQTVGGERTLRMDFLEKMAEGGLVILDESHNAGGVSAVMKRGKNSPDAGEKSGRAAVVRKLVSLSKGVFYSSATYAKRPDVLDLYSKTDMGLVADVDKLAESLNAGGIPLQQAVASMLAKAGQYLRREKSFDGIEYATSAANVDKKFAEKSSEVMREIMRFDMMKMAAVKDLDRTLKAEARTITGNRSTGGAGASTTSFASVMHNMIDQMLLTLKIQTAIDEAVTALRRSEKPVITLSNTMGAAIDYYVQDAGISPGDAIDLNFGDLLKRYAEKSKRVTEGKTFGPKETRYLTDKELGPTAVKQYKKIIKTINDFDFTGYQISPVDAIHEGLRKHGYKSGEITGRQSVIDYSSGTPIYRKRNSQQTTAAGKRKIINDFNNGLLDAVILNRSGSTGLSLHSSPKVGGDTRKRHMILAQAEFNIDTHMQMLGRINRTGQLHLPSYSQLVADIPAEKRPASILSKKMAMLNANTTAGKDSAVKARDVPDFMNDYGDEVVAEIMNDNKEIHDLLGKPLSEAQTGGGFEVDGAMRKVTGRIPVLSLADQESLYKTIEDEYSEYIDTLTKTGQNQLEARAMDLDAKFKGATVVVPTIGDGKSPFSEPVHAETVDVKKLGKPYSIDQIKELFYKAGYKDSGSSQEKASEFEKKLSEAYQKQEQNIDAMPEDDDREIKRKDIARTLLNEQRLRVSEMFNRFGPGKSVILHSTKGQSYLGIVGKFENKSVAKNFFAPGQWKITVYVADAAKQITLPLSKFEDQGWQLEGARPSDVKEALELGQSTSRENRVILTGNMLAAYGFDKTGQIVNYTAHSGGVRQGVLMPAKFDLNAAINARPVTFASPYLAVEFSRLNDGHLRSANGEVRIMKAGSNFNLYTPASKVKGGAIFTNKRLVELLGDFYKRSNEMTASIPQSKIDEALRILYPITGSLQAVSKKAGKKFMNEKGIKFSRGQSAGSMADEVKSWLPARVKKLLDSGKVKVIQSHDGNAQAFYNPSSDTITLVADNISEQSLPGILAHELLHRAEATDSPLKSALNRFEKATQDSFSEAAKGNASPIENRAAQRVIAADTPIRNQAEEFRAYLVSEYSKARDTFTGVIKKAMQDLVAAIRVALLRSGLDMGFIKTLTPADLAAMSKYGAKSTGESPLSNEPPIATLSSKKDDHYASWSINSDPEFDEDGNESEGDDYALIDKIYVPEVGRKRGIGRKLLRNAIYEIQHEYPGIDIKIAALPFGENKMEMEDLVNFYEKEGFGVSNTDGHAVIMEYSGPEIQKLENVPESDGTLYSKSIDDIRNQLTDNIAMRLHNNRTFNNWWDKSVGTQFHKSLKDKYFGRVYNASMQYEHDVSMSANEAADKAPLWLPKLETLKESIQEARKTGWQRIKDAKAIGKAIFDTTIHDTPMSDSELKAEGYTPKQIEMYKQFYSAVNKSLDDLGKSEMYRMARIMKNANGDPLQFAPDGLSLMDTADFYAGQITSQDTIDLIHDGQEEDSAAAPFIQKAESIERLKSEGYAPLMRFGKYTVDVVSKDGDRLFYGMLESQKEANQIAAAMRSTYKDAKVTQGEMSQKSWKQFQGITPETLEIFARMAGVKEEVAFQEYLKLAVNNRSALKRLIHRKKIPGYSIDAQRILATFITSNARQISKNKNLGNLLKSISEIPKEKGDVIDEALDLYDYVQNPQAENGVASFIKSGLFTWYLGGSLAAAGVNLTQTATTTTPYLAQFSKYGDMPKIIVSAAKFAANPKSIQDVDLKSALKKADEQGVTAPQEVHYLYGTANPDSLAKLPFLRPLQNAWGIFFSLAEAYNRRLAFIAAYSIAKKGGKEFNDAIKAMQDKGVEAPSADPYEFASQAVDQTQFVYTKSSRPNWARSSVGQMVFTFKTFSISYLEFISRLPPKEKLLALGILVALAGLSGLPGSDDLDDVIDTIGQEAGYNTNSKMWKRQVLEDMLGKEMAAYAQYGLSNALPIDISSRLGIANVIPGSAILKKSETDKSRGVMEFAGPAGSIAQKAIQTFEAMGSIDTLAGKAETFGKTMLPKAITDIIQAIDMENTGQYRDFRGYNVTKVGTGDAIAKAVGFNPNTVAERRRPEREFMQSSKMTSLTESEIVGLWAAGVYEKDSDKIDAAKRLLKDWNMKNPETPIKINMQQVIRRTKAMRQTSAERLLKAAPKELRRYASEMAIG